MQPVLERESLNDDISIVEADFTTVEFKSPGDSMTPMGSIENVETPLIDIREYAHEKEP